MRLLTLARDLTRRKARERDHLFVAEGVRAVGELLDSPLDVVGVLCGAQITEADRGRILDEMARPRPLEVSVVSEREFASAAGTDSPQGILAIARIPERSLDALRGREDLRILVLDGIQDPGNVGTILRTAHALGAGATVALPGTVDLWNAKVVRSSMGANFHHYALHASWPALGPFLSEDSVPLWAADRGGDAIGDAMAPRKLAIALGNEGVGLSDPIRAAAVRTVSIAMSAGAESLNVAVAAGIILYQLRGNRGPG